MNYTRALEVSPRPHQTLAQAFASVTNQGTTGRFMQKLMKEYGGRLVLEAIMRMRGSDIKEPQSYLIGICKNLYSDPRRRGSENSQKIFDSLLEEVE